MRGSQQTVGFWRRAFAYLVDALPIGLLAFVFADRVLGIEGLHLHTGMRLTLTSLWRRELVRLGAFVVWILYCAVMEATPLGGTLGKVILQIEVVDARGRHLTVWRSLLRNLAKLLSYLPLGFGFFWVALDRKRQAWHDKIAGTYVVAR